MGWGKTTSGLREWPEKLLVLAVKMSHAHRSYDKRQKVYLEETLPVGDVLGVASLIFLIGAMGEAPWRHVTGLSEH
jgi:hypothetical protein